METTSFDHFPKQNTNFDNDTSRLSLQFPTINTFAPDFFANDNFFPPPPSPHRTENENAKKRSSQDLTFRPTKRNRVLTCTIPACANRTFADEPNLNRHKREVHGQARHHCPVATCERHLRGFKRRDNCINHQKRNHGSVSGSATKTRLEDMVSSRDSSVHGTDDGDVLSGNESGERDGEEKVKKEGEREGEGEESLLLKMDRLKALVRKKKRVERDIAQAMTELQQALRP